MKYLIISCFNHYDTRTKHIISSIDKEKDEYVYLTTDFNHFAKTRYKADLENTKQIHVLSYKKNISVSRLLSHHLFAKKVYKYCKSYKPDVVYSLFPPNSLVKYLVKYKKQHGIKLVLDCYDMWPESFSNGGSKLNFLLKKWGNLRDKYVEEADRIVFVANSMRYEFLETLKHKFDDEMTLFPSLGPTKKHESKPLDKNQISFCYLGNVNHILDIDKCVELLSKINEKKHVVFHIIGSGIALDELVKKLDEHKIEHVLYGNLFDEREKRRVFAKCDLGINLPKEEIRSTMSLKAIEYLYNSIPFVNTATFDMHDIVKNNKVGFNLENMDETVKVIVSLDDKKMEELRNNCHKAYDELFSSKNYVEVLKF